VLDVTIPGRAPNSVSAKKHLFAFYLITIKGMKILLEYFFLILGMFAAT